MFTSASSVSVTVIVCPSPVIEASAMLLEILFLQRYTTFGKNFHEITFVGRVILESEGCPETIK